MHCLTWGLPLPPAEADTLPARLRALILRAPAPGQTEANALLASAAAEHVLAPLGKAGYAFGCLVPVWRRRHSVHQRVCWRLHAPRAACSSAVL